jgi:hypothetical protein
MQDGIELVWTAKEIAGAINRGEREVFHLLTTGQLPGARKIGGRWVISRQNLRQIFLEQKERAESAA